MAPSMLKSSSAACPVLALLVTGATATAWRTPPLLIGECSTVWTSSFAKYILPYKVLFGSRGHFRWWAPYKDGTATEIGEGLYLTPPISTTRSDGTWETHYFGANRFTPDPANSSNCCCEYVGGRGPGKPRVLADYCVAAVPHSAHLPMQEVCAPFVQPCPADNVTALQEMGKPFIEIYATCAPPRAEGLWVLAIVIALLALCAGVVLFTLSRSWCLRQGVSCSGGPGPEAEGPEDAGYQSLGGGEERPEVKALRSSITKQLLASLGGAPSKTKDGDAEALPSTPSTEEGEEAASPMSTEASWSRSTSLLSRFLGDDLPASAWFRSSTERPQSAGVASRWQRVASGPAMV